MGDLHQPNDRRRCSKLWRTKAAVEQITRDILEPTRLTDERFSPGFIYTWSLRVKKTLDVLQALRYVDMKNDEYELTDKGRTVFKEVVVEHEDDILARFKEERMSF